MQDHTIIDEGKEKTMRQFIQEPTETALRQRLSKMHNVAMEDPRTVSIVQIRLGRNKPCPCGSGKRFKLCCGNKVNKGKFEVKRTNQRR